MCTYDLKYNDYFTNMSSGLSSLLATADIADVTLAVEGKFFKTHQVILSIFSPYFRELFATSPCKHPIFFMKDVKYQVIKDLLTFMYEGKVQITENEFNDFVDTAKALKVKGLTNMAEPEHIKQPNCNAIENNVLNKRSHDNSYADENEVKIMPMVKKNKTLPMPPVPLLSEVSVLPVSAPSTTRNVDQKKSRVCSEHVEVQDLCEIQMKEEQHSFIEDKQQVKLHLDPDLQYDAEGTIELDADDDESFDLLEPVANMIELPMSEPEGEPDKLAPGMFQTVVVKSEFQEGNESDLEARMGALEQQLSVLVASIQSKKPSKTVGCTEALAKRFPVGSMDELRAMEKVLANEAAFNELTCLLNSVGGANVKQYVRRCLERVITFEVATNFSWLGMKGKLVFKNLKLAEAIVSSGNKFNYTHFAIEEMVKEWLRRAHERQAAQEKKKRTQLAKQL